LKTGYKGLKVLSSFSNISPFFSSLFIEFGSNIHSWYEGGEMFISAYGLNGADGMGTGWLYWGVSTSALKGILPWISEKKNW